MNTTMQKSRLILVLFIMVCGFFTVGELVSRLMMMGDSSHLEIERQIFMNLGETDGDRFFKEDPELFWVLRQFIPFQKSETGIFFGMFSNSEGLRDDEVPKPKLEGTYRILCLGESRTFGVRISYDQSYPEQLERLMRPPTGFSDVEVINAGIPGYSSYQGLQFLMKWGALYEPDLVIAGFGLNDRNSLNDMTDEDYAALLRGETVEPWYRRLAIYQHVRRLILWTRFQIADLTYDPNESRTDESFPETFFGGAEPRVPVNSYFGNLAAIAAFSKSLGSDIILINWPFKSQVTQKESKLNDYQMAMKDFAVRQQIALVDLTRSLSRESSQYWIDQFHLNGEGYGRVAAYVHDVIILNIWSQSQSQSQSQSGTTQESDDIANPLDGGRDATGFSRLEE